MTSPGHLDSTSGALVSLPAGSLPAGGVTRSNAPVVLSLDASNYTKWSIYMKASIGRAGLIGDIDGTTTANPADPTWSSNDYAVLNYLHSGISEDLADMVLSRDQTARQLWLSLLELFSANKASKAIYLDNDFRQLVQGASSITEYCRRQKQLSDALADNDSPVSNRALVLNTLRGLGPRFASAATVISMTDPLPTFVRARSMLLMEEMQQANAAFNAVSTALVAQARPSASSCTGTACRGDSSSTGLGKPFTKQKKNKPRNGGGSTTNRPATPAPSGPWSAPSLSSTPTWDDSALIAALNSLALQQGSWVMDSGASSHMTNDDDNFSSSIAAVAPTAQQVPPRRLDFLFTDLNRPLPGQPTAAACPPTARSAASLAAASRQDAPAARQATTAARQAADAARQAVAGLSSAARKISSTTSSSTPAAPSAAAPVVKITRSGRVSRPKDMLNLHVSDTTIAPVPTTCRKPCRTPTGGRPWLMSIRLSSTTTHGLLYLAFLGLLDQLHREFAMIDLGPLHFFLGIAVTMNVDGLFLSQRQYAMDLLQRAGMSDCHPLATPVDTQAKLSSSDGDLLADATEYRSLAGALQYLTLTRPDVSYAVQQICLHMHAPCAPHLALVKRVLRYVRGTLEFGLHLRASSSTTLTAYSDADWAGCPDSRRSTSGYCVYYGDSLISWSSRRQTIVSRSSAEDEYRAVAHAVAECCWIRYNCWTKHGERGVMMEDNEEEEEDHDMYPNYGDTATGHDEDEEAGGAEYEEEELKMKRREELKMKMHQMSPLMMIFVGPSLMHTEKQKLKTRSESERAC
ncbi:hypothetical protein QYE76_048826 [Lolium multiflorum]|uniref:Reverse transcriptase Ty1/copia-type domain-containing protein n=1 Tax=Lolium multiflorum TaxID=4521 RepID=A0AAD8WFF9_LOLMU|nr:hypothetical protein QYE76_048826 [Lolium multiflorum]